MDTYLVPAAVFTALIGVIELAKILARALSKKPRETERLIIAVNALAITVGDHTKAMNEFISSAGKYAERAKDGRKEIIKITEKSGVDLDELDRKFDLADQRTCGYHEQITEAQKEANTSIRELANMLRGDTSPRGIRPSRGVLDDG